MSYIVTGFFNLANISKIHPFLFYVSVTVFFLLPNTFIYAFTINGFLGCFSTLVIMSNAAMDICVQDSWELVFLFLSIVLLGLEFLGHLKTVFLTLRSAAFCP